MASCNDAESDGISEEIELLQAIYVHELELQGPDERPSLVNLFLHPSTGDDDHGSKYVCLNLSFSIPHKYPFLSPGISINNPRGLSDAHVTSIQENLVALAKEKNGSPMLYDLIEYAKECLSENNIPSCPCVICLEHFLEEEKFVKTECYHYFHVVCLGNYVDHFLSENENIEIVCPMCRLEIVYNKNEYEIENDLTSTEEIFVYKPDNTQLEAQAERQKIFEYQKHKGGIIDIEEERTKYLIGIKDNTKRETGGSNNVEPEFFMIPVAVSDETPSSISELSWESARPDQSHIDIEEQSYRKGDEIHSGDKRNTDRNKTQRATEDSSSKNFKGLENNNKNMPREDQSKLGNQSQTKARPRRRDNKDQKRAQLTDRDDNGIRKGQAKNTLTVQANIGRENFREMNSQKGRAGSSGTSIGYQGETVDSRDSGSGKEPKGEPPEVRRTGENRRRTPQESTGRQTKGRYKNYSRVLEEERKPGKQVRGNFRNSPSPKNNRGRDSGNSKEQQIEDRKLLLPSDDPSKISENSKEQQSREDRNEPRKPEMTTKDRDLNNWRNGRSTQKKDQMMSTEQQKESKEVVVSLKQKDTNDGGSILKEGRDQNQTSELKSDSTPSGNLKFGKQEVSESNNAKNVTFSNNSTSRQMTKKQPSRTDRNQNQRNPRSTRTPTRRRPQENTKDCKQTDEKNDRRTYSSVTSMSNHQAKRRDPPVSENPKKSFNKSEENFPRKAETVSSNTGDSITSESGSMKKNKPQIRRAPPGFENVKPGTSINVEPKVSSMQSVQTTSDHGCVRKDKPSIRRPPPGFENVTPKNI